VYAKLAGKMSAGTPSWKRLKVTTLLIYQTHITLGGAYGAAYDGGRGRVTSFIAVGGRLAAATARKLFVLKAEVAAYCTQLTIAPVQGTCVCLNRNIWVAEGESA